MLLCEANEIRNGAMRFERVAQRSVLTNRVVVSTPDAFAHQYLGFFELTDDALNRTFGDAHLTCNVPYTRVGALGDADQDMSMVAQKGPSTHLHTGNLNRVLTIVKTYS